MASRMKKEAPEIPSGSMADIAFLLLIFFLVTTTIASDKGILNILPPKVDPNLPPPEVVLNERNIFNIMVNLNDQLLIENEDFRSNTEGLSEEVKAFILNFGAPDEEAQALYNSLPPSLRALANRDPESSDHPMTGGAVVSIKTNRGTGYDMYLEVLDLVKRAYFEIYAERVGLTADEYRALSNDNPGEAELRERGAADIPMAISIAEPDRTSE